MKQLTTAQRDAMRGWMWLRVAAREYGYDPDKLEHLKKFLELVDSNGGLLPDLGENNNTVPDPE